MTRRTLVSDLETTVAKKAYENTRLAKYLEQRVLELKPKKTQGDIAAEAGFVNPNMITMFKTGASKVPLDRVPALALALGWRRAIIVSALLIGACGALSAAVYRDPPGAPLPRRQPGERGRLALVLTNRDLWLVSVATLVFAGMQTVWMAFLALYLEAVVGLGLLPASRYLAIAQGGGVLGRVAFGLLSDRVFGGRRRLPLAIAGCGSALCTVALAYTGPGVGAAWLGPLALVFGFVGIGWNGVQHTLMAELAGPRTAGTAVGLGLAISSLGVTIGPLVFGWCVGAAGGFRGPWIGLALVMLGGLALLALVRERPL